VVKEKTKRESLVTELSYSNPAKLMNYMKAKKASGNSSFRSQAEYVSHVDAYARNSAANEHEEDETGRRVKYAKLLAHKRLNDTRTAPKPPKKPDSAQ
jgi:hypothetical protein